MSAIYNSVALTASKSLAKPEGIRQSAELLRKNKGLYKYHHCVQTSFSEFLNLMSTCNCRGKKYPCMMCEKPGCGAHEFTMTAVKDNEFAMVCAACVKRIHTMSNQDYYNWCEVLSASGGVGAQRLRTPVN